MNNKKKSLIINTFYRYGIIEIFWLIKNVLLTRIFYPKARLIRFPFDVRNARFISIGKNMTVGRGCRLEAHPKHSNNSNQCLTIGRNVEINDYVHIVAGESVIIGDNVLIASKVFISDLNHGQYSGHLQSSPLIEPNNRPLNRNPVLIESNVWIGEFVSVLPGVTIGQGSIIGTMSVVTKSIPPYSIAVGAPARPIKQYDFKNKEWKKIY